jgi:hypothetical protein
MSHLRTDHMANHWIILDSNFKLPIHIINHATKFNWQISWSGRVTRKMPAWLVSWKAALISVDANRLQLNIASVGCCSFCSRSRAVGGRMHAMRRVTWPVIDRSWPHCCRWRKPFCLIKCDSKASYFTEYLFMVPQSEPARPARLHPTRPVNGLR